MPLSDLLSGSTTALRTTQDLINHANKLVETDLAQVREAMEAARVARAELEKEVLPLHRKLEPACRAYADMRVRLLVGRDGETRLLDRCELAQGDINNLLWLGHAAHGCVDSCAPPGAEQDVPGPCVPGLCRDKLLSTKQLEDVLGGSPWQRADAEVHRSCGQADHALHVNPPVGLESATDSQEAATPVGGNGAAAVRERALPMALAAIADAPMARLGRWHATPACAHRRCRAFL
mmetsp:Transcript_125203/g.348379  ORF Transcript_125203/g.348379 Transcript_125203/m.348379 type:complete len:235 (-) Transcript_125203:27-731(-)